jgi:ferredoxin
MASPHRSVRVDPGLCEGHALCIDLAPEVFDLSEEDVATCAAPAVDALWDKVIAAVNACPRGAIIVESVEHPSAQERIERTPTP